MNGFELEPIHSKASVEMCPQSKIRTNKIFELPRLVFSGFEVDEEMNKCLVNVNPDVINNQINTAVRSK